MRIIIDDIFKTVSQWDPAKQATGDDLLHLAGPNREREFDDVISSILTPGQLRSYIGATARVFEISGIREVALASAIQKFNPPKL